MCQKLRTYKDPILYTNSIFLLSGIYSYLQEDIIYTCIGVLNFIISGLYHLFHEQKLAALDNVIAKLSVSIFIHDMILHWHKFPVIAMFNILCNLFPLVYCYYYSRKHGHTYEYLHLGVHWFANFFGLITHCIVYNKF